MKQRNVELVSVTARLPIDAKEWLEKKAAQHVTSLNAELIRAIRVRQEAERAAG
jgi:hypothetical protein